MVDLHGLFVNEALEYAKQALQSAKLRNNKVVRFIVGMPSLQVGSRCSEASLTVDSCRLRQGITYEGWQGEDSTSVGKTL